MADEMDDPIESLETTIAFSPRDWSINRRDAWIYGIIMGWGSALSEVAATHGWSKEKVERLRRLHREFLNLSRRKTK